MADLSTYRFLTPEMAEAFEGTTPAQVRVDLARLATDERWAIPPGWVRHLEDQLGFGLDPVDAQILGLRYLADAMLPESP